ncbi:MAG: PQQ-dependent sugar dehydrogenase, partial [Verrucomicrobiales bacterium]
MTKKSLLSLSALLTLPLSADVALEHFSAGYERPVWLGTPAGESEHLWVLEQKGLISLVDQKSGKKLAEPFLDLTGHTEISANERGLLGLAFPADFMQSGRFYVNLTNNDGDTEIIRFQTNKDNRLKADPASAEILLTIKQDFGNHNGGWIDFGPDGMLYVGMGDGGSANDPKARAQDPKTLLGSMLRLDVSGEKGYAVPDDNPFDNEIWMIGLRNPWRCSWDPQTKQLWIADVGQNVWEEINVIDFPKTRGANFGWRLREASVANP